MNTGLGGRASVCCSRAPTNTFLSLPISEPLWRNDGIVLDHLWCPSCPNQSWVKRTEPWGVGIWVTECRRPSWRKTHPVPAWMVSSSCKWELGSQNWCISRIISGKCFPEDCSEASVTLWHRRILWRKGLKQVMGSCLPMIVVDFVGKWLAVNTSVFPH